MVKSVLFAFIAVLLVPYTSYCADSEKGSETAPPVSGSVVNGYRILSIDPAEKAPELKVYRGDYIKFKFDPSRQDPLLSIPALGIQTNLSANSAEEPYFKMKTPGTYAFSLGDVRGHITVINFRATSYREVSAAAAAELIKNENPIVLDVRTRNEYKQGRLHQSILIPVQELQGRLGELAMYKDQEILIYCATGNRSTVAAKILIDRGFKHIVNMRGGIYDWSRRNYPVTR